MREWRAANRERARASFQRWAAKNPEANRARLQDWRERNLEWAREYDRTRARDPESERKWAAARNARKREAFLEDVIPLVVLERDDGTCGICGEDVDPLDFHVDHRLPLAAGGLHAYFNVQVAHPRCNQIKGARVVA
jgi:5-methylcytosine-specific restriction endonuclease McrA